MVTRFALRTIALGMLVPIFMGMPHLSINNLGWNNENTTRVQRILIVEPDEDYKIGFCFALKQSGPSIFRTPLNVTAVMTCGFDCNPDSVFSLGRKKIDRRGVHHSALVDISNSPISDQEPSLGDKLAGRPNCLTGSQVFLRHSNFYGDTEWFLAAPIIYGIGNSHCRLRPRELWHE